MTARQLKVVWAFVAVACATAPVPGCIPPAEEAVATVDGEYKITAGDVEFYYERGAAAGVWPEGEDVDETVRSIVEAAVMGKVLEREAEERGYAEAADVKSQLQAIRTQKLADFMFKSIEASAPVTRAEIYDYYCKSRKRRTYSFISCETPERAEEAYAALRAGMPWDRAVAEFSVFTAYAGPGGKWDVPMDYTADEPSRALFTLEVGEYTRPVEVPGALLWQIYRFDKEVHGPGRSFEEEAPDIELFLSREKTYARFRELVRGWRRAVPIARNQDLWQDILTRPCEKLWTDYRGRDLALSEVGGIPVAYDAVWDGVQRFFGVPAADVEEFRRNKAERYERVWDVYLRDSEDRALLQHQALREGVDRWPSFEREMASRRAALLIDALYQGEFAANVPAPTDEEIRAYYEAHKDDFYQPEKVEVYLVAMPDRAELERFYNEAKAGADVVITGEARNRAREKAEQEMAELPPAAPPERREWLGVVAVNAFDSPSDPPLAAELRPRVFPAGKLNVLSEVFRLRDGRWAFYEPIYHAPAVQYDLDDAEAAYRCRAEVFAAKMGSPETAAAADAWLASLRSRHRVVWNDDAVAAVTAEIRKNAPAK